MANNCSEMLNKDWNRVYTEHCYFYPGRDCPHWDYGTKCGRIGELIPTAEDMTNDGE
jgi:hypothetical protein